MNSEFINSFMPITFHPKSCRKLEKFFGSDDQKIVFEDLKGPTWSPEKFKKLEEVLEDKRINRRKYQYKYKTANRLQKTPLYDYVNKSL